jgi:UDP-2,3-diacylglucosamine pyrophosphatase LpxH
MATIKIDDITPADTELFVNSENFMEELSNDELLTVVGGLEKIWEVRDLDGKLLYYVDDGKG